MLADGMITARIRSTVELDDAGKMLETPRNSCLSGKALILIYGGHFLIPGHPSLYTPISIVLKNEPLTNPGCHGHLTKG